MTKITDLSSWMEKLFEYDSMGRVIKVTDEDGRESTATYHALGKPLTALCQNGGGTTYEYDDYGRVISESLEEGCTRIYYYDELGRLAGFLNGREDIQPEEAEMITFGYGYDAAGRLISQTAPDEDYGYVYDDNGNLLRVTDPKGSCTYTYDAKNRVTSYEDASGNCIEYTYDNRGNLITLEYPDHTEVHYQYDSCNRLISVIDWEDRETKYTYFDNGKLRKIENANGTVAEFEYDDWARPVGQEERTGEGNLILLQNWSRDGVGQLVQENQVFYDPTDPENSVDFEREMVYNYCDNRWLNDVEKDGSLETHSYDDGGNLVQGSRYTYNDANRLIAFDNSPLIYDNDGNIENVMIGDTDLWLEYDSRNRLFCSDGEVIADYEYSPQNLLEKRTVDGIETEYVYDPLPRLSRLLMKTTDDVTTKYIYGLGLIGEEVDGEFKTYHYDYRGSTVAITDEGENITDTFEYDTYGKLLSHTGSTETPFCYNGRAGVMTEPNGLYYMRNRFYSPDLKRFINPDLIAGDITNAITLNRYAYANNNPVSFVDPLGLSAERGDGIYDVDKMMDIITSEEFLMPFIEIVTGQFLYDMIGDFLLEKVFLPIVNTIERFLSRFDFTYSRGFTISCASGTLLFGYQIGLTLDSKGDLAVQWTKSDGTSTGLGASITAFEMYTNAPDVFDLNGHGSFTGGSAGVPIQGVPVVAGVDYNAIPNDTDTPYVGVTINGGIGAPGGEIHSGFSVTETYKGAKINIFKLFYFLSDLMLEY